MSLLLPAFSTHKRNIGHDWNLKCCKFDSDTSQIFKINLPKYFLRYKSIWHIFVLFIWIIGTFFKRSSDVCIFVHLNSSRNVGFSRKGGGHSATKSWDSVTAILD